MGTNVAFCSAGYNFKTCDFTSGDVNMNRVIIQYCRRAMSESCERLYQFILDLISCRDWYHPGDKCIWIKMKFVKSESF